MAIAAAATPLPAEPRFREEAEAVISIFDQVRAGQPLPVMEAQAVASALYVAMRLTGKVVVPRMPLYHPNAYSAVHAINVALLAMGAAEGLKLDEESVRAIGLSGLLADIGMARAPLELINKPGVFTEEERAIVNRHPIDGAAIIFEAEGALDLPAIAAYEHHIRLDGSGYPAMTHRRSTQQVSRLIAVCDTSHALSCPRPFREALGLDGIASFLQERSGVYYDPEMVTVVTNLMRGGRAPS